MISSLQRVAQSRFVRNVAIVATGTAGAQAITMAFSPIVTRLYGPDAFGALGTFTALLGIVTPLAALSYPIAIVLPKADQDAVGLAKLSACIAFITAGLLTVMILLYGERLARALSVTAVAGFLLLLPVAMLFSAFQQIVQQWLIRKKQFGVMARVAVLQAVAINSAKVGVGWFHPVGTVLILLAATGYAFQTFLLFLGVYKNPLARPAPIIRFNDEEQKTSRSIWGLAKKHRDFPQYRAPQVAINAMSESLPILLLANFFGTTSAGFYTLARMVMGVPSALIGKSVGDVFYPRITEANHNQEDLYPLILKATKALAVVGAVPFGVIVLFGPWLFSLGFGQEWRIAGEYARWLALWLYLGFINKPAVAAIPTLRMQPWLLLYELFSTGTKVIALFVGFYLLTNDIYAIALMSILGALTYAVLIGSVLIRSRG